MLLVKPSTVENFLSGSSTPILELSRPLVLIDDNFNFPTRPIVAHGIDSSGCILPNARISIQSADVFDTECHGRMCDQQSLMKAGCMAPKCACMQMNQSGKVAISWDLKITCEDGSTIQTKFMSKQFTREFVMTGDLPMNVTASSFSHNVVDDRLFDAGQDVCDYINLRGGFKIVLWVKRGVVMDQGVDQPNNGLPYNAARTTVQSGNLNHHIVRIIPMNPERIDLERLQAIKFDVTAGFRVN